MYELTLSWAIHIMQFSMIPDDGWELKAMRIIKDVKLAALAIAIAVLPVKAAAQTNADGTWQLRATPNAPRLTINGPILSGYTGCRPFSAQMQGTLERGRIVVDPLAGRCTAAQQRVENQFLGQLRAVGSLTSRNNRLMARTSRGALLFSAIPTQVSSSGQSIGVSSGSWRLVRVGNQAAVSPAGASQILRVTGSRLLFEGFCNTFSGSAAFGPITNGVGTMAVFISDQTQRLCADPRLEAGDQDVLAAFESVRSFKLTGTDLHLTDAKGDTLATFRSN
jgi:heat shock protein HslJ